MRKTSKRTSPPYLIHSLNSLFHPTLILSIHPLTPISLLILSSFSHSSHPTISAYSLYPSYPTLSQLFLTPTSYPLNPVIVPHFLSRHSLSLFLPSHLTPISQPYLSLNPLIPFSHSLSYSSHTSLPQLLLSLSSLIPLSCPAFATLSHPSLSPFSLPNFHFTHLSHPSFSHHSISPSILSPRCRSLLLKNLTHSITPPSLPALPQ